MTQSAAKGKPLSAFSLSGFNKKPERPVSACGDSEVCPPARKAPDLSQWAEREPETIPTPPGCGFLAMAGEKQMLPPGYNLLRNPDAVPLMPKGLIKTAQEKLEGAVKEWVAGIAAREAEWKEKGKRSRPEIRVIKSDVGTGKTHFAAKTVASTVLARPTCYTERKKGKNGSAPEAKGETRVPFVVTAPSHELVNQILGDIEASYPGVSVGVYQGKKRAGCLRGDSLDELALAGVSSHNLCKAEDEVTQDDGSTAKRTNYCKHYFNCPVMKQRAMLNRDPFGFGIIEEGVVVRDLADRFENGVADYPDIVGTVHAMSSIASHPYLVKNPRGVVVDESVTQNLLNEGKFPLSVLTSPSRKTVRLTKAEREQGLTEEDAMADYAALARTAGIAVVRATARKDCVVETLVKEWTQDAARSECRKRGKFEKEAASIAAGKLFRKTSIETLKAAISLAKRVAWQAATSDANFGPDSSDEEIRELCKIPKSAEAVREWRFWTIVGERIELVYESEDKPARRREERIGLDGDSVEVSWRGNFTWADSDILLLDASVSMELLEACFPNHDVVFIDATLFGVGEVMPQYVHAHVGMTMSNSALLPNARASKEDFEKAANMALTLKRCLDTIVLMHPFGQILVASTKKVEENILNDYVVGGRSSTALRRLGLITPATVAEGRVAGEHYGNLRGKNGYKHAQAVVLVGKMEPPEDVIRRLARAAYYDKPERADDVWPAHEGNEESPKAPERVRLRMRDGSFMETTQWTYRNRYERAIHKSMREEEMIQAAGRARAAQRDPLDPSTWPHIHIIGNVFPDGFVYDSFSHVGDLARGASLFAAACENGGAIWADAVVDRELAVCASDDPVRRRKTGTDWLTRRGFTSTELPVGWARVAVKCEYGRPHNCFVWLPALTEGETPEQKAMAAMREAGKTVISAKLSATTEIPETVAADLSATRRPLEERDGRMMETMKEAATVVRKEKGTPEEIGKKVFSAHFGVAVERVFIEKAVGRIGDDEPDPIDPDDLDQAIPF